MFVIFLDLRNIQTWSNASISSVSPKYFFLFSSRNSFYFFDKLRTVQWINEQICITESNWEPFNIGWSTVVNVLDFILIDNPLWAFLLESPWMVITEFYVIYQCYENWPGISTGLARLVQPVKPRTGSKTGSVSLWKCLIRNWLQNNRADGDVELLAVPPVFNCQCWIHSSNHTRTHIKFRI